MDPKTKSSTNGLKAELNVEKLQMIAAELILPGRFALKLFSAAFELLTNFLAGILGSNLVGKHFHLVLSALVLFGPALSLWVSKYSIFANSNHYLYRKFLRSTWGWTCTLSGSFVFLLSFLASRSLSFSIRHLSRLAVAALLWWGSRRLLTLLEDAAGTCYEPVSSTRDVQNPLLVLHEDQTKASCLQAHLLWRGYEVSQDILILCFSSLLLVEEISVFGRYLNQEQHPQRSLCTPLRILFFFCVLLLLMWIFLLLCMLAYFPKWPSQQLGGALGYLGWRGLYQGWYRLHLNWGSPGMPGNKLFPPTDFKTK